MGTLTPGASYIYERDGDTIYARESGTSKRVAIGWDYKQQPYTNQVLEEAKMWLEIRRLAETNPALQNALNNAITIYKLIKDDPTNT